RTSGASGWPRRCRPLLLSTWQDCRNAELQKGSWKDRGRRVKDSVRSLLQPCNPAISSVSPKVPMIDDADDAGVDRRFLWKVRKARFLAPHEEDVFAGAGANRIDSDQRLSRRLSIRVE